jgi:5-methylcytosine-specific restriction endonuclease McrA
MSLFYLIAIIIIIVGVNKLIKEWERLRHERLLRELRERWLREEEPKNRKGPGYPIDWLYRKKEIFKKYNGKCALCGTSINHKYHIHHILPLSKGGDHSLSNLELLCENCHISKHPNLEAAFERHRFFQEMGLINTRHGRSKRTAKFVKKSTVDWECDICKNKIMRGQSYYGNYYTKICIECSPLKIKKLARKNEK